MRSWRFRVDRPPAEADVDEVSVQNQDEGVTCMTLSELLGRVHVVRSRRRNFGPDSDWFDNDNKQQKKSH